MKTLAMPPALSTRRARACRRSVARRAQRCRPALSSPKARAMPARCPRGVRRCRHSCRPEGARAIARGFSPWKTEAPPLPPARPPGRAGEPFMPASFSPYTQESTKDGEGNCDPQRTQRKRGGKSCMNWRTQQTSALVASIGDRLSRICCDTLLLCGDHGGLVAGRGRGRIPDRNCRPVGASLGQGTVHAGQRASICLRSLATFF